MTLSHILAPPALALAALSATAQQVAPTSELDLDLVGTQMLALPAQAVPAPFTVDVQIGGAPYTLSLRPYSLRSPDFTVEVQSADGELRGWEPAAPRTYRGEIVGIPGTDVRASLENGELRGTILDQFHEFWGVQPARDFDPSVKSGAHVVYHKDDIRAQNVTCGTTAHWDDPVNPGPGYNGTGLKLAEVAFDTDFEFYQSNSSSVNATVADIENVMNSVEQHYENDCNVTFDITTIIVRTTSNDPYTSNNASTMLNEFTNHWNSQQSGWKRDLAHFMTGKNMQGSTIGIAWLNAICNNSAYGVSQSKFSFSLASRAALTAHEMGHNFSAQHCNGNPTGCKIMCSGLGGCNGINGFAPVSINSITNKAGNTPCLLDLAPPIATDWFDTFPSTTIDTTAWIVNDNVTVSTQGMNEPSPPNALLLNATSAALKDQDEIRTNFIPLNGPGPWFVGFHSQHIGVEAGEDLVCDYSDVSGQWVELARITSDGVDQTAFTETVVQVPALGIGPEFRIRFRGEVDQTDDHWFVDDVSVGLNPPCTPAFTYCTAKISSEGCPPLILSTGTASVSSPQPFDIQAALTIAQKPGLLFYGYAPAALPFQGGTLCVQPPTRRTPVQLAGGTPGFPCDGTYTFDMNAHIQSGIDPLLVSGSTANAQYWFRDNGSPSLTGLTGGLEFQICD